MHHDVTSSLLHEIRRQGESEIFSCPWIIIFITTSNDCLFFSNLVVSSQPVPRLGLHELFCFMIHLIAD